MRLIILAYVACTAVHYFSTLSHKNDTIFEEKLIAYKMCFDFSLQFCLKPFSFSEEERIMVWSHMYIGLHVKFPLFLSDFNKTWLFSTDFRNILKYQIS